MPTLVAAVLAMEDIPYALPLTIAALLFAAAGLAGAARAFLLRRRSARMRQALAAAALEHLSLEVVCRRYSNSVTIGGIAAQTVRALAERGLLRLSAGPEGRLRRYALTRDGSRIVNEMLRRQAAREKLASERAREW